MLLELKPEYQADPARAVAAVLQVRRSGTADSARYAGHASTQEIRPADDQPLRAASGGHDFLQPEARRIAGRRGRRRSRSSPTRRFPPASARTSRARPRRSRARSATLGAADRRDLVVYIVLGILYESYIHPLTILSGLPSAGFGALLTLYLFHMDLNIYAFVGLDHADRHRGEERHHADRLRARRRAQAGPDADARRSTKAA